jgi:hypothetical protein
MFLMEASLVAIHKVARTGKVQTRDQDLEKLLRKAAKHFATQKQGRSRGVTKKRPRKPTRRDVKR